MTLRQRLLTATAMLLVVPVAAHAQTASGTFNLGQIETVTVTGQNAQTAPMSASQVDAETAYSLHDVNLEQTLDTMPGVNGSSTHGPRNEMLLQVRGFDRFETPIAIDGIRVYLPADNRLDFGRFLTADLAEIQVAKGYVSVLNGPGAMGGEVNLVTKKPVNELEIDARAGETFGRDLSTNASDASLSVGTNQGNFYLQGSVAMDYQARTELSHDYVATATQPAGFRLASQSRDITYHAKAGWTPNDTDEYSISYIKEVGAKGAPFSVSDPISTQKDWTWPYWDIDSLYFLSHTKLGDSAALETKVYYNTFNNGVFSWDNANYNTQTTPKAFRSYYKDYAYGGSVELSNNFGSLDTLKGSFFYRRDNHKEWETIYSPAFTEPPQLDTEDTYSLAAENTYHVRSDLDAVAGISYDWRNLSTAQDFVDPTTATGPGSTGTFINYPLKNGSAPNGQAALIWQASDTASYYANVSDRSRFPTIFERFSTKFGTAASNPGLKAERAANFEVGTHQSFDGLKLDGAVFYSDISNAIESVILPAPAPANTTQSQNVGHSTYYGFEAQADWQALDELTLGGNYTYTFRHARPPASVGVFQLTDTPTHKAYFYGTWTPSDFFSVTPNVEVESKRWTQNTGGTAYYKTGAVGLLGLSADYRLSSSWDFNIGAKNLLDTNYQLTAGMPEQGRTFFLELRFKQ